MEKISNCEKMIMSVIWGCSDHPSLHSVMSTVNQRYGKEWKPQTVSTFVTRLAKKGYLNVYRKGRYSYYMPLISLTEFRRQTLDDLVTTLYGGNINAFKRQIREIYGP